jgi:hypothetical protein
MVVQQTFLSQAFPNRMRTTTNTGFPSATSTGNALVVGSNSGGNLFLNNHPPHSSYPTSNSSAPHLKSHHQNGSHHQLSSYMMSHLINPEAHGFATPPPSVLPTAQNTPIDSHTNGQTQQFLTPTSTSSLFGCQQVPELNHTRAVHSPAITPPEHAASMDAKLLAAAVSSSTNGTTHTTSQQTAAVNAFHQTLATAAASGQINGGNTPSAVSAALALNQLLSTPAGAAAMAQNPMLLAAMSALNNGANWQHPSVLPALLAILHQNYDPQGFAAIQNALIQEAQQAQHRQLLAQLTQHQLAAAAVAAMSQDQISLEKAAAALHNSGDPRLISHPQWMSPPLSSNTPASSSSPLIFSGDDLSNTGATAGTSNVPSSGSSGLEENSSPAPRGDVFSPHRGHHSTSSFDSLADYNRWDCDDVQQFLTEQSILSEKESIAVAVLAGFSSIR